MSGNQKQRPHRLQVLDQFGRRKSLPDTLDQFQVLQTGNGGKGVLLLGLGPNPGVVREMFPEDLEVAYLECPDLMAQMPASHRSALPAHWRAITPADLGRSELAPRMILFYRPGLALFPDFWSPLLAQIDLQYVPRLTPRHKDVVWLPGSERRLLTRELDQAFTDAGLIVRSLPEGLSTTEMIRWLHGERPKLFFSVNFHGLDPWGRNHALLQQAGVQVCVWCVDNPFHLLSGLRSAYWQRCRLFVTDNWFIPHLIDHGASQVVHLPLAAAEHFLCRDSRPVSSALSDPRQNWRNLGDRIVFVGRSAFPARDRFFAGCNVSNELAKSAANIMVQGGRPDFAWWWSHLQSPPLWPGQTVRKVGFAAEESSRQHRIHHLREAGRSGNLTIFGDSNWENLLPGKHDIRPEVDYYGPLVHIYRQARFTLNLTSLLLPHGLTQRHFDVWSAGGVLLTDTTPGLAVFDQRLTREVAFDSPKALSAVTRRLEADPSLADDLRHAWQFHIRANHLYAQRIITVLESLETHRSIPQSHCSR